jgi:putative oxygen-independent coproporphyrinogen III oxidase
MPGVAFAPLSSTQRASFGTVPFGIYVHVPFCASRCGYCAFNTYTTADLGDDALRRNFANAARREIAAARAFFGDEAPVVETVFFGGGTPTELDSFDLVAILATVRAEFDTAEDLEVTVEANPDSVGRRDLEVLRAGGFTRLSLGMQSVRSHVLAVLERSHTPGATARAAAHAHAVGFEHLSIDVMYGTPQESDRDWQASLEAALSMQPDHLSAYALTVEPRTRLASQVRHGRLRAPDEDALVARYEMADEVLSAAGFSWYEISNWSRGAAARCRHNLLYWRNQHWWGIGPGAHSHIAGRRWCNIAHPREYANAVAGDRMPVASQEELDEQARQIEAVLLGVRLADGFVLDVEPAVERQLLDDGLIEVIRVELTPVFRLSRRGRLLADVVSRTVIDELHPGRACFATVTKP